MENTGGNASWLNGNNKGKNRGIQNMVRSALLNSNQHENKWCCEAEIPAEVYRCIIHSTLNNISPHFEWYVQNPIIHELRIFGCDIYPIT